MGVKSIIFWRVLPGLVVALVSTVGWFASHEVPLGVFFAMVIPLSKGLLPLSIVGHGKMKGTPEVLDDLMPQPCPENALFLDLPGGYQFPQQGIRMCC